MTIKASTVGIAAAVVAASLAVAGCSSTTPGNASPSTASTSTSATGTTSTDPFGALQACQVLNQLVAGQGFDPGSNKTAHNQCTASKPDFGAYGVFLDPVQGLGEYSAENPGSVSAQINGRKALRVEPDRGMCEFALEVGQHARALTTATMANPKDNAQACPSAKQLAEKLEPLLPKDQ